MVIELPWIGALESFKTINTENPIEEIWHLIDFFTSEETISTCDPPVDRDLIPYICESITQAQEFRLSASSCGEHTKPLLTYYSMHNLTKAVLALETNSRSAGYHGLKHVEVPSDDSFIGVSAKVNGGVFSDLLLFKGFSPNRNLKVDEFVKT